MRLIFATTLKEWLLLWRDKVGLLILFILPVCLVLFISITRGHEASDVQSVKLLLLNHDNGAVTTIIQQGLEKNKSFIITNIDNKTSLNLHQAKAAVAKGKYQGLIIVPKDTTNNITSYIRRVIVQRINVKKPEQSIQIFLDPAMMPSLKHNITGYIHLLLYQAETTIKAQIIEQAYKIPVMKVNNNIVSVSAKSINQQQQHVIPNSSQQNVPAWALFGMFFIVMPLAGIMVRERSEGVNQRLKIAPINLISLFIGKIIAFVCVNLIQLLLMLMVGVILLPLFGLPELNLWQHIVPVLIIGISASFAATGFGLFIGSYAKTYEQATIVGPFIIVIAAAIGGVLAPIYLMPQFLQNISHYSPLGWAHSAFIDTFVRNASISSYLPNLYKLWMFFAVCLLLALLKSSGPERTRLT